jgi:two-component system, LytTR family, response regulator
MIRALIVDDEPHCREYLSGLIQKFCPDVNIMGMAKSVEDAINQFSKHMPDLVFLDIQMPAESGFDFLDHPMIRGAKPAIIFTTAYDQYAIKAFRYSAADYLLKPINIKELSEAIRKVSNRQYSVNYSFVSELFEQMNTHKPVRKLCLPVSDGYDLAEIESILYFEAQGSYCTVFFTDRKPVLVCKPVSYFEQILNPTVFFRTHRTYMVNLDKVISYNSDEEYLLLEDKSKVIVSKRKKVALLKLLKGVIQ